MINSNISQIINESSLQATQLRHYHTSKPNHSTDLPHANNNHKNRPPPHKEFVVFKMAHIWHDMTCRVTSISRVGHQYARAIFRIVVLASEWIRLSWKRCNTLSTSDVLRTPLQWTAVSPSQSKDCRSPYVEISWCVRKSSFLLRLTFCFWTSMSSTSLWVIHTIASIAQMASMPMSTSQESMEHVNRELKCSCIQSFERRLVRVVGFVRRDV